MAKRKPAAIAPDQGLHEIQQLANQLGPMEAHCELIERNLDHLVKITYDKAPLQRAGNGQTYKLARAPKSNVHEKQEERLIEQAIWRQFPLFGSPDFLQQECPRVVAYQTPLQNSRKDNGWGKIDLLGASPQGLPVVIELKRGSASDTLLRMLVEALAYALALQKAWNQGTRLRAEWAERMNKPEAVQKYDAALLSVPLVLLAPAAFWEKRIRGGAGRFSRQVFKEAGTPFRSLMKKCETRGFPVHCVQFEEVGKPISPDFRVKNVSHVTLPG